MAVETIGIKYKLPSIKFSVTPVGNQSYNLHYRLKLGDITDTTGGGWQAQEGVFTVNNKGENINNTTIVNLVENQNYQIRLTNIANPSNVSYFHFTACQNLSAGNSPYYNKILFPNQTYDWYIRNVSDFMLPVLGDEEKPGLDWYYALTGSKAITVEFDAYRSIELYALDNWKFGTSYDNQGERYQAFHCEGANICRMPFGVNADADHTAQSVFIDNPGVFGFSFYLEEGYTYADLISFRVKSANSETISNYSETWSLRITPEGTFQGVQWFKNTDTETVLETQLAGIITTEKWYTIILDSSGGFSIYDGEGVFVGSAVAATRPFGGSTSYEEDSPIIFGNIRGMSKGLLVNRMFKTRTLGVEENNIVDPNILRIISSYKYYPVPAYYQNSERKFLDNVSVISKVSDTKVSIVIRPDILSKGIVPGTLEIKLLISATEEEITSKTFTLKTVEANTDTVGFKIDFANDYANAMTLLKEKFYTKHGQWGGYNGGVSSHLLFGNGKDALIMSNQGDRYTGVVSGVGKESEKLANYDGYGGDAFYDAFNDTRRGQNYKTRVGSVLVSSQYFPYGEMTVGLLVPKNTYGICPALWFFHYQEYSESDSRYPQWIERGWPVQGNAEDGYYTVVNNEIDMELPSHNIQGSFENWTEVANAYFDPLALDTQYQIGLRQTATNLDYTKIGTFRLVNVNAPNLFESWEQVAYDFKPRIYPNFSSIKFNNWIGEYDSGNGWGRSLEDYKAEETYLALLTQAKDFNDTFADNRYHDYTIKWYPDRTELWIDGVYVRTNRAFVPFNVMKYTLGGWFPSMPKRKVITDAETGAFRYEVRDTDNGNTLVVPGQQPVGTWAGINADFEVCHFMINKIEFVPYNNVDMSKLEYNGESFPESGLREII